MTSSLENWCTSTLTNVLSMDTSKKIVNYLKKKYIFTGADFIQLLSSVLAGQNIDFTQECHLNRHQILAIRKAWFTDFGEGEPTDKQFQNNSQNNIYNISQKTNNHQSYPDRGSPSLRPAYDSSRVKKCLYSDNNYSDEYAENIDGIYSLNGGVHHGPFINTIQNDSIRDFKNGQYSMTNSIATKYLVNDQIPINQNAPRLPRLNQSLSGNDSGYHLDNKPSYDEYIETTTLLSRNRGTRNTYNLPEYREPDNLMNSAYNRQSHNVYNLPEYRRTYNEDGISNPTMNSHIFKSRIPEIQNNYYNSRNSLHSETYNVPHHSSYNFSKIPEGHKTIDNYDTDNPAYHIASVIDFFANEFYDVTSNVDFNQFRLNCFLKCKNALSKEVFRDVWEICGDMHHVEHRLSEPNSPVASNRRVDVNDANVPNRSCKAVDVPDTSLHNVGVSDPSLQNVGVSEPSLKIEGLLDTARFGRHSASDLPANYSPTVEHIGLPTKNESLQQNIPKINDVINKDNYFNFTDGINMQNSSGGFMCRSPVNVSREIEKVDERNPMSFDLKRESPSHNEKFDNEPTDDGPKITTSKKTIADVSNWINSLPERMISKESKKIAVSIVEIHNIDGNRMSESKGLKYLQNDKNLSIGPREQLKLAKAWTNVLDEEERMALYMKESSPVASWVGQKAVKMQF